MSILHFSFEYFTDAILTIDTIVYFCHELPDHLHHHFAKD